MNKRHFLKTTFGAAVALLGGNGLVTATPQPYQTICDKLLHTQPFFGDVGHAHLIRARAIPANNWGDDGCLPDCLSKFAASQRGMIPETQIQIERKPMEVENIDEQQFDRSVLLQIIRGASYHVATRINCNDGFSNGIVPCVHIASNRLAIKNRRIPGTILVCNERNKQLSGILKTYASHAYTIHHHSDIPYNCVLTVARGVFLYDSAGVIATFNGKKTVWLDSIDNYAALTSFA